MSLAKGDRVKLNGPAEDMGIPKRGIGTVVRITADYVKIHWDGTKDTQDTYYAPDYVEKVAPDA